MLNPFQGQPRAFQMIFLLEIWERFGYYTMQGILTLYFIRFLGFSDTEAYHTFGALSALMWGMMALGGYLGDKVLGTKRTIVLGLILLALGYLALSLATKNEVFLALGLICVGSGIFKPNPSSLLSKCYVENDPRLHSGFTLYYMAINLGGVIALLIGPSVSARFGYPYAYFLSFIGLLLALANYWFRRHLLTDISNVLDDNPVKPIIWFVVITGIVLLTIGAHYLLSHVLVTSVLLWSVVVVTLVIYAGCMRRENRVSRLRMVVALVLMIEAVGFFILYQQMPTSLTLFAVNNVRPTFLGVTFNPQSFLGLNPMWIILLGPLFARGYGWLQDKNIVFSLPAKFATGMICCGFSFLILYFARFYHDMYGQVSAWWLVGSYLLQSTGELFVSALGVAMVAELVPTQITGFVMGMWFLTTAVAGVVGAKVASYTALPQTPHSGVESLFVYTDVFINIGLVTLGLGIFMWFLVKPLNRYIKN